MISWTAKYGLPDSSRAVLARHMACASATTAVYSRDLPSFSCHARIGEHAAGDEVWHGFIQIGADLAW